nr:hypothetical protein [Armatimonas sp.]
MLEVSLNDLRALENEGKIRIWTIDRVESWVMSQDGTKELRANAGKIAKRNLPGVVIQMKKNNEILIEGQIPGNLIKRGK